MGSLFNYARVYDAHIVVMDVSDVLCYSSPPETRTHNLFPMVTSAIAVLRSASRTRMRREAGDTGRTFRKRLSEDLSPKFPICRKRPPRFCSYDVAP